MVYDLYLAFVSTRVITINWISINYNLHAILIKIDPRIHSTYLPTHLYIVVIFTFNLKIKRYILEFYTSWYIIRLVNNVFKELPEMSVEKWVQ